MPRVRRDKHVSVSLVPLTNTFRFELHRQSIPPTVTKPNGVLRPNRGPSAKRGTLTKSLRRLVCAHKTNLG